MATFSQMEIATNAPLSAPVALTMLPIALNANPDLNMIQLANVIALGIYQQMKFLAF